MFCQISAYGQTFDTTKLSVGRNRIINSREFGEAPPHSSSFKIKLDGVIGEKKLIQGQDLLADPDAAKAGTNQLILQMRKSGGESAGGGHLLELKIAASIQKMFEGLQKKNPNNLNLQTLQYFIENTVIKLSNEKKDFFLQKDKNSSEMELRDAVNFFPQRWLLKLYIPAWEKYYALKMDVEDLIYHEFLLFFFNHDKKYSRSKFVELGSSQASALTLVIDSVEVTTPDVYIQIEGQTIDRQESVLIDCSFPKDDKKVTTFSYYRRDKLLASTQNSAVNPFVRCDEFFEIQTKLQLATKSCPVIIDLDRKAVESGYIALLGVRTTCDK